MEYSLYFILPSTFLSCNSLKSFPSHLLLLTHLITLFEYHYKLWIFKYVLCYNQLPSIFDA